MELLPGLGCQADWQQGDVGLIGCHAVSSNARVGSAAAALEVRDLAAGLYGPGAFEAESAAAALEEV